MILHDTSVYLFRCRRCLAAFVLTTPDEMYGAHNQWDMLIANGCRVCTKGQIEYLGEFFGRQTVVKGRTREDGD